MTFINRYNTKHYITLTLIFSILIISFWFIISDKKINEISISNIETQIGDSIDSFNGVVVYYNGKIGNVSGRNLTADNYNLGLKYQCVEFVKRYYYEYYKHKMPDSWGHAKDFYDQSIEDGGLNKRRGLTQFGNPSSTKPKVGEIIIFDMTTLNPYGHVAIISQVDENELEIIQQNPGPFSPSRIKFDLKLESEQWNIESDLVLGRLRK